MLRFVFMGVVGLVMLPAAALPQIAAPTLVVEMFTSAFCPTCPAAERKMKEVAAEYPDMLVLFAHVDYWDRGDNVDPHGSPDNTQRQYDYSNRLSARPGQVFTPMPILNGQWVAGPPLFLNWNKTLQQAMAAPKPSALQVQRDEQGGLTVRIAEHLPLNNRMLWVMGVEPVDDTPVWRVKTLQHVDVRNKRTVRVPRALTPPDPHVVVVLQESGPGPIEAVGMR